MVSLGNAVGSRCIARRALNRVGYQAGKKNPGVERDKQTTFSSLFLSRSVLDNHCGSISIF